MDKNQFSKENEELERSYIPPDYSEAKDVEDEDDEDDDDIDLDDDDDYDEEEEDDDPADSEKLLEVTESSPIVKPPVIQTEENKPQQTFNNNQFNNQRMATPNWPNPAGNNGGWGGQTNNTFPWNSGQNNNSWGNKPTGSFGTGWGGNTGTTPGWNNSQNSQIQSLDRTKKVIICDVLDCLICTLEGPQKLGLIPRDTWDITLRLDVWFSMKRFSYLDRIYAMIPKTLIINSSGSENWKILLNYVSCSLASFLRVPTSTIQIITQSYISQPKEDMIKGVTNGIPVEDIVYIGTQSGLSGQSSSDVDCANSLGIDYIDLQRFLTLYS